MLKAPNLAELRWLTHGFGQRDSIYPADITTVRQIHSDIVIEATVPGGDRIADGDAVVSNQPGVVVGIRTADCVPVLIADTRTHSIASIHAGWRGSAAGIAIRAVDAMVNQYGSRPQDLVAAVGPSIGVCCYQVGEEVARQFGRWLPELGHAEGRKNLNLAAMNELQLRGVGVQNVWTAGVCTYCESEHYFSFRREKEQAGRMLSYIGTVRG